MSNLEWLFAVIQDSYQRAPIVVIALSALVILPIVAIGSWAVQSTARRSRQQAALRQAQRKAAGPGWEGLPRTAAAVTGAPLRAWLTEEGGQRKTLPLEGQTIRIGRHADNDVRLADSSVHRYHAMIEHTPEEDFVITNLSGEAGNGIRVNGERTERTSLSDGDVIQLGRAKLKFESAPL